MDDDTKITFVFMVLMVLMWIIMLVATISCANSPDVGNVSSQSHIMIPISTGDGTIFAMI